MAVAAAMAVTWLRLQLRLANAVAVVVAVAVGVDVTVPLSASCQNLTPCHWEWPAKPIEHTLEQTETDRTNTSQALSTHRRLSKHDTEQGTTNRTQLGRNDETI